jgi:hypothetical protein
MKQPGLKSNLGILKTNLSNLSIKLKTLKQKLTTLKDSLTGKKIELAMRSQFDQEALDLYALYGIEKTTEKLKLDKYRNLRLEGQETEPYTGYGYKTANLRELQKGIKYLHLASGTPDIRYIVPDFIGISSANVKKYLGDKKLNLSVEWQTAVNALTDQEKQESLDSKTLNQKFINEIQKIESSVKQVFIDNAKKDTVLNQVFQTSGINEFLQKAKKANLKLMVRSTGKEDTDQLANAGGNETIGNVYPASETVLTAMGQGPKDPTTGEDKLGVVSSYFGKKSFTQRIKAGDPSLYEEPPTPALIQVMIGETLDDITTCGVMFTEEPEGDISKDKKIDPQTHQILTTGITRIECSYGHNEGVVNSMVPVDVYYVNNKQEINSIIREKNKRVIPGPNGFKVIPNPEKDPMVYKSALSREEVKALKTLANYLEYYYRKPMDVEFVLKKNPNNPNKRIIYIVQARPIVNNEKKIQASYILKPEDFHNKVNGEVIGIAGGALRLVKNKDECIIADTLKEALEFYQKLSNTDNINCIFVKTMAPATSHEATQFRTEQKAVICIPDIKTIEKWLAEGKNILVDMQQELATTWDTSKNLNQAIQDGTLLLAGWINYPIPMKLTLNDRLDKKHKKKFSELSTDELKENLTNFTQLEYFDPIRKQAESELTSELEKKIKGKSKIDRAKTLPKIKEYSANLKKVDETGARSSLLKICVASAVLILDMISNKPGDRDFIEQANLIFSHLLIHAERVSATLKIKPSDNNYYQRLYEIRFLEAILFQVPSKDIFNNYSFESFFTNIYLKEKISEKELIQKGVPLDSTEESKLLVVYGTASGYILSDETKQKWFDLLAQLRKTTPAMQKNFNRMFAGLAKNNLLTIWFLLNFGPSTKNFAIADATQAAIVIDGLCKDYDKDQSFIDTLKKQKDRFKELEISLWSSPSKFEKQKQNLEGIGKYFKETSFFNAYGTAGNLGKIFATKVMEEFITLFDTSIKELESSQEYTDESIQIQNVKSLIELFLTFLSEWVDKFPEAKNIDSAGGTYMTPAQLKLQAAKDRLPVITNFTKKDQLKINPTYDVSIAAIGGIKPDVIDPSTLEEIFTFTHQSLLNILSFLNKRINIWTSAPNILSELNRYLTQEIKNITYNFNTYYGFSTNKLPTTITLTGISFEKNNIILKYNYPLRGHSMNILINYDPKTKITSITCEMSGAGSNAGGNEYARFYKIADFIDVTSKTLNLRSNIKFECEDRKIIWGWEIDNDTWVNNKTGVEKITSLILASVGLSYSVDGYVKSVGLEAVIYADILDRDYLNLTNLQKQTLLNNIIDFSYQGDRIHSIFVTALEKLPQDASSRHKWLKTIEILSRLVNENSPYRINTECFFFKKYHTAFWGAHPTLGNLAIENTQYHGLNAKNYLTNATIPQINIKQDYFKFREATKIFNYLCQVAEHFDKACWDKFLDLIKSNPKFVLELQDLSLDDIEGNGPAAANLTTQSTLPGRSLKLIASLKKLFRNAFTTSQIRDKAKETAESLIASTTGLGQPGWQAIKEEYDVK